MPVKGAIIVGDTGRGRMTFTSLINAVAYLNVGGSGGEIPVSDFLRQGEDLLGKEYALTVYVNFTPKDGHRFDGLRSLLKK